MAGLETLDEFAPRDTDPVSLGDDAIRETRQKTKASVGLEHYLDGPHRIPQGATGVRPAAGRAGRIYFNSDTKAVEYDNGAAWQSTAEQKARATILWHPTQQQIINSGVAFHFPFDTIIDDPGGYADLQNKRIMQPANSIGIASAYLEFAPPTNAGFGIIVAIEQHDGTAWRTLVQNWVYSVSFGTVTAMVDSRWGLPLRVTVLNATPAYMYVNATAVGASPRFGYAMLGRTS